MTISQSQTVFSPWLTPVRLVSVANIAGTYYNGQNNNGVGATFTISASSLTIDSVLCVVGDRILLQTQTNTYEQGIYIVKRIGTTVVLERAEDQQNVEQLKAGEYVAVGAGTIEAGAFYTLIEPLPNVIGLDAFIFAAISEAGEVILPTVAGDLASFYDVNGVIQDSGITAASVAALLAAGGGGSSSVRSATISIAGSTASTVISDAAISASSVVIARFVSSANVVTVQTVLPAAGQFTLVTDTAPSTSVVEYISFTPSAALLTAGVVVGKGSYGGGSATFVIADANITAGMVVTANFQSQVTPSKIYTALAGAGTITFVTSANPGVCVIEYAAMLPGNISGLGLHAANYTYAGGFASIAISDASITAASIVTAEFKSQSVVALIQKVTPSAGTLTVLASIDPGPSVVAYIATAAGGGGSGSGVNFSGSPSVANAIPVFSDTTGDLKPASGASTFGQALAVAGALSSTSGPITSGSSGDAGSFISFPTTAANGTLIFAAVNAGGAFDTTVSNAASVGQSQVISIPDVGASTGQFLVKTAAFVSGNVPMASGTAGLMVDSGRPAGNFAQVAMTAAQFNGMYAAPYLLVAAPGANSMIVVDSIQLVMTYGSAAFAAGGVVSAQYDVTANGGGVHASSDEAAADFFAVASTVFKLNGGLVLAPFSTCANKGLYLSNLTQAFTTGTGSAFIVKVYYHVISMIA